MARTISGGQRTQLQTRNSGTWLRVWIKNGAGSYVDFSTVNSQDYRLSATVTSALEQAADTATVVFRAGKGTNSIAPAITAATINSSTRGVDVLRDIKIDCAVIASNTTPSGGDWTTIFEGTIDKASATASGETLTITATNRMKPVLKATFASATTVGPSVALQTVLGTLLSSAMSSPPSLVTSVSPAWAPDTFTAKRGDTLWSALTALTDQIGWLVRYRWNGNTPELRLFGPNRAPASADFTLSSVEVRDVQSFDFDGDSIRNSISVLYRVGGVPTTVTRTDSASITAYGTQSMVIAEAASSQIKGTTAANRMADAILADLKTPVVSHVLTTLHPFWPAEVGDVFDVPSNTVTHDATQRLAAVSVVHTFEAGGGFTTLGLRGAPASRGRSWLDTAVVPEDVPPSVTARVTSSNATSHTVTVSTEPAGGVVRWMGGTATRTAGALVNVDVADGATWTFARPVFAAGDVEALFSGSVNGFTASDSVTITEQGRDTVALLTRARVFWVSGAWYTVRVSASSPNANADGTIRLVQTNGAYVEIAGFVRPVDGTDTGTITDSVTTTTTDGDYSVTSGVAGVSFRDYSVARPAVGAQPAKVSWRVSASGLASDIASVAVEPQRPLTPGRVGVLAPVQSGADYTVRFRAYLADASTVTSTSAVTATVLRVPVGGGSPTTSTPTITWDGANAWFTFTFTRVAGDEYSMVLTINPNTATNQTDVPVSVPMYPIVPVDPWSSAYANVPTTFGAIQVYFVYTPTATSYNARITGSPGASTLLGITTGANAGVSGKLFPGGGYNTLQTLSVTVDACDANGVVIASKNFGANYYVAP